MRSDVVEQRPWLRGRRWLMAVRMSRSTAWAVVGAGGMLVLAGMALQVHSPLGLAVAAVGLVLAGTGYLSRQLTAVSQSGDAWMHQRWTVRPLGGPDHMAEISGSEQLLWLAAALWCSLTLITAITAMIWGDVAGLITVCVGGIATLLIELFARRYVR